MKDNIRPPLVLLIISVITAAALVITYNLTYVDMSGVMTDEMLKACVQLYGEGEYEIVTSQEIEGLNAVITAGEDAYAFDIIVNGYNKKGIRVMVGVEKGEVVGVIPLKIAETPGLGTKVENASFLDLFKGISGKANIVKGSTKGDNEVSAVSGATYSSQGVGDAVNLALDVFENRGGYGIE